MERTHKNSNKRKKNTFNKFKKTKNINDFIRFKKLRVRAKYLIKTNKTNSWHQFTSNLNTKVEPSSVWNSIKSLKGQKRNRQINILDNETNTIVTPQVVTDLIGKHFQSNSSNINYTPAFRQIKFDSKNLLVISKTNPKNIDQIQFNEEISMNEINYALSKCKNKSTGPNGIPYSFLHYLPTMENNYYGLYSTRYGKKNFPPKLEK
jgi:hypothetical protein